MFDFLKSVSIQFLPIAFILIINGRKEYKLYILLLAAYLFDITIHYIPYITGMHLSFLSFNWIGKVFSISWSLLVIYGLRWLSPAEVGLKMPTKGQMIQAGLLGIALSLLSFFDGLPEGNLGESVLFMATLPGLSEELVYRGILFAILNRFLDSKLASMGIVSLLFIMAHIVAPHPSGGLIWNHSLVLMTQLIVWTSALGYLRLRTGSVWPCVLCHNLINMLPDLTAWLMLAKL